MHTPIDATAEAQMFTDIREKYEGLLLGFATFREQLQTFGKESPHLNWDVKGLSESRRSFEVEYLDLKIRVTLSLQPHIDLRGIINFYRLDEFDPLAARKIDSVGFDANTGDTGIRHKAGPELSVKVGRHAAVLLVSAMRAAYIAQGDGP